jgi:transposase
VNSKDWSELEKRRLAWLVRRGKSTRQISAALDRRIGSVKKMALEMKLVLRKKAKKALREATQPHREILTDQPNDEGTCGS